jgi:DNA-binding transcriptional MerR regulator
MTPSPGPLWTIDELGGEVALALSVDYAGAPSSRVRDVPDRRTIRYYSTLGLIDRPVMRGRTALYTRRHLVQLVAIKRLQATGLSLAEVQQRLLGLSDAALETLARVPERAPVVPDRGEAFWAATPAPVPETPPQEPVSAGLPWQGIPLSGQVMLLFEPSRALQEEDLELIRRTAAPLLELLDRRRLLRESPLAPNPLPGTGEEV